VFRGHALLGRVLLDDKLRPPGPALPKELDFFVALHVAFAGSTQHFPLNVSGRFSTLCWAPTPLFLRHLFVFKKTCPPLCHFFPFFFRSFPTLEVSLILHYNVRFFLFTPHVRSSWVCLAFPHTTIGPPHLGFQGTRPFLGFFPSSRPLWSIPLTQLLGGCPVPVTSRSFVYLLFTC